MVNSYLGGKLLTIRLLAGNLALAFRKGHFSLLWLNVVLPIAGIENTTCLELKMPCAWYEKRPAHGIGNVPRMERKTTGAQKKCPALFALPQGVSSDCGAFLFLFFVCFFNKKLSLV